MKPERIFNILAKKGSCSYRKTAEVLDFYNFFLEYMAPDKRMKTIFKMKNANISYEEIGDFLGITEEEVLRLQRSSYELLANVFISFEMDQYIEDNMLFDNEESDYLFKKVYRKVLELNKGGSSNEQKKKRRTNQHSKRLFGNLL